MWNNFFRAILKIGGGRLSPPCLDWLTYRSLKNISKIIFQKTTLIPGGGECIVYATMSGALGMLVPFQSNEDADFFQTLEMHMRQETTFLTGRDHLSFRGYYYPQKVFLLFIIKWTYYIISISMIFNQDATSCVHLDANPEFRWFIS